MEKSFIARMKDMVGTFMEAKMAVFTWKQEDQDTKIIT
jgi:hypothetical protein